MVSAIIAVLVLISPIYAESASNLENYLDCSSEKKIDIVFVFDTTNSMGGEISELRATANKFATDLEASNIDYQLGLVEFRDFPETCDGFSCGSPGDYAYSVKGNGTLTSEIDTFGSWLNELKAGGGGSPGPEAVLAALRHAGSDLSWRSDAEKAIIVLTDAGAHPDGSCCNAEGDTLEGTIFELVDIGARAYIIGPEDASLKNIAENTGGQFYEIRSGLSLKPLLEEITKSLGCSFRTDVAASCENNQLEVSVQLIGKETIPYISGQTEAWMYLDQAESISRINLRYDQEAEAYLGRVPDVCGSVELKVYGRAGERSAVQTVQVECGACGTEAAEELGTLSISGWAYDDSNGDGIKGADEAGLEGWAILLLKPDGSSIAQESDKNGYYIFTGLLPGSYKVVANAQEDWTATAPETGAKDVELVDVHESEIDFGFKQKQDVNQNLESNNDTIQKWIRTFSGGQYSWANSVQTTNDGGYITIGRFDSSDDHEMAGTSASGYVGLSWVIKCDATGDMLWDRKIDFNAFDNSEANWIRSIQQTSDGGYIIGGGVYHDESGEDFLLIKMDSMGNEEWYRYFDRSNHADKGESICQTSDGGYIIAGTTTDDAWLIKTDSSGNKEWDTTFGGDGYDRVHSVQQTRDGGYIIAGNFATSETNQDAWLIKTDSSGSKEWDKILKSEGTVGSGANSVHQTSDGGYIVAGQFRLDAWLIKTDSSGSKEWDTTFGGDGYDWLNSVQQTRDGGFIIAGTTTNSLDNQYAWLIKTDSSGNEEWERTFGGEPYKRIDSASSVRQTNDGGYIIAGTYNQELWLIKTDAYGSADEDES